MSDYQDAIQNPRHSFADPDLRRGVPVTDELGLPKPITGGFASVYQMVCDGRKWAVRCFLRHHTDSEERYAAIGKALGSSRLPYVVAFQYVKQGIRVKGQWYPILKMEWVDGEPINLYVHKRRGSPQSLMALSKSFLQMTQDLRGRSIAHGDLQHGNILVVDGALRLVDYDGMYVPALLGRTSHELGHPNYQHPARGREDFGPYLDAFAEWVIYVSLAALAIRPDLWDLLGAHDEQLLFCQRDYMNPEGSRALGLMRDSGDPALRVLADSFRQVIMLGRLQDVPPLAISGDPMEIAEMDLSPKVKRSLGRSLSKLLAPAEDKIAPPPVAPPPAKVPDAPGAIPGWVQDHIEVSRPVLAPPRAKEKVSVLGAVILSFGLFRFHAAGYFPVATAWWGSAGGVVFSGLVLAQGFLTRPEYKKKQAVQVQLRKAGRQMKAVAARRRRAEGGLATVLAREAKSVGNIEYRLAQIPVRESLDLDAVLKRLQSELGDVSKDAERLNRAESAELASASKAGTRGSVSRIIERYRKERGRLEKQKGEIGARAEKRRQAIRAGYNHETLALTQKLGSVKANFAKDAGVFQGRIKDIELIMGVQREIEENLRRELDAYSKINFGAYLRKMASFS